MDSQVAGILEETYSDLSHLLYFLVWFGGVFNPISCVLAGLAFDHLHSLRVRDSHGKALSLRRLICKSAFFTKFGLYYKI